MKNSSTIMRKSLTRVAVFIGLIGRRVGECVGSGKKRAWRFVVSGQSLEATDNAPLATDQSADCQTRLGQLSFDHARCLQRRAAPVTCYSRFGLAASRGTPAPDGLEVSRGAERRAR